MPPVGIVLEVEVAADPNAVTRGVIPCACDVEGHQVGDGVHVGGGEAGVVNVPKSNRGVVLCQSGTLDTSRYNAVVVDVVWVRSSILRNESDRAAR